MSDGVAEETLDEGEHCASRLGLRLEPAALEQFAFESREEALAHGVVIGIADRTHSIGYLSPIAGIFPDSVIITREGHPFEGCVLGVIGSIRRRGVLFALACLPDGSRALIPANGLTGTRVIVAVRARAGKPIPARVLLAALAICLSYAISSTLSATDRSVPPQKGSVVQLNLGFFDLRDPPGGALTESLWGTARRARAPRRARDPGAPNCPHAGGAANEASHE
jgi:hypothetical protein